MMQTVWYYYLGWVILAAALGFIVATVFSRWLRLPRTLYLIPYVLAVGIFSWLFFRWARLDLRQLVLDNWLWGVVGALLVGIFVVRNILSQPASPRSKGARLALDLFWLGGIYGFMDAILLSVIPVIGAWNALTLLGWTENPLGNVAAGVVCFLASLVVTGAYHAGYAEYQGKRLMAPIIGNGVMTLGYLLTQNPFSAIGSHIAMHVAGVLHGPETTAQLPPHY